MTLGSGQTENTQIRVLKNLPCYAKSVKYFSNNTTDENTSNWDLNPMLQIVLSVRREMGYIQDGFNMKAWPLQTKTPDKVTMLYVLDQLWHCTVSG